MIELGFYVLISIAVLGVREFGTCFIFFVKFGRKTCPLSGSLSMPTFDTC